jgi:hypothetical protein
MTSGLVQWYKLSMGRLLADEGGKIESESKVLILFCRWMIYYSAIWRDQRILNLYIWHWSRAHPFRTLNNMVHLDLTARERCVIIITSIKWWHTFYSIWASTRTQIALSCLSMYFPVRSAMKCDMNAFNAISFKIYNLFDIIIL